MNTPLFLLNHSTFSQREQCKKVFSPNDFTKITRNSVKNTKQRFLFGKFCVRLYLVKGTPMRKPEE